MSQQYGISLELVDMDALFNDVMSDSIASFTPQPTVINHVAEAGTDQDVRNVIQKRLQNRIVDEALNNAPICSIDCAAPVTSRYNLGNECPTCGEVVRERRMVSELWIAAHPDVGSFVHPRIWMLFSKYFGNLKLKKFERSTVTLVRKSDIMAWMVDPTYRPEALAKTGRSRFKALTVLLEEHGYVRDVNYFRMNFKKVMALLTDFDNWHRIMGTGGSQKRHEAAVKHAKNERDRRDWVKLVEDYGHCFFPKHLPLISPLLVVAEENDGRITVDPVYTAQVDAGKTIGSIYTHIRPLRPRDIIGRTMRANRQLAYFYVDYRRELSSQKTGTYRGKNSSTFIPFSGRATITPISEPHDPYELHAPWRWSVNLFSIQIENKLRLRGYSPKEILRMVDYACMQYCPIIDGIFDELIAESPGGKGLMVVPLRNPTLVQLSVETLYITKIIKDVNQCSIRISVLVIKMCNGDFDGDQLMVWCPIDSVEMDLAEALLPEHGMISATSPNEVAHGMILHNEVISMQNNFLGDDTEDCCAGTGL